MKAKPNIVFLLTDHQAFYGHGESVGGPKIQKPTFENLVSRGVEFLRAYTCCPLCAPARRSMLTGVFPHTHGVLSNFSFIPFKFKTYLDILAEEGYHNYYYGKWHAGDGTAHDHHCEGFSYPDYNNPYTKPQYKDYLKKKNLPDFQLKLQRSFLPPSSKLGKELQAKILKGEPHFLNRAASNEDTIGIMTSPKETHEAFFLAHLACEKLIEIAERGDQEPFHLRVDFWGPHQPYYATQEYLNLYPPEKIPEHPSFRDDLKNKPRLYKFERNYPLNKNGKIIFPNPLPWSEWQKILALNYAQQTLIDEAADLIIDTLDKLGFDKNTLIILAADHGDAVGCHGGHFDKDAYMPEEVMRIPLGLRFPGVIPAGKKSDLLVSNLDIPLTILDAAGSSFPHDVHGQSLISMFTDDMNNWREDLMCESNGHFTINIGRMLVTERYKYIFNDKDKDELYDLKEDPFEMNNLIGNNHYEMILNDLKRRLVEWRQKYNDTITRKEIIQDRLSFAREHMDEATLLEM
ncbi:MAG: sulfatase-like hydrolase/transferase [Promethearchaeota archaeon]